MEKEERIAMHERYKYLRRMRNGTGGQDARPKGGHKLSAPDGWVAPAGGLL